MKARIASGVAAVLAVCLYAEFGPALLVRCRSDHNQSNAKKHRSIAVARDQAKADLRTAASALRYLLEPEPNSQSFQLMVVSNTPTAKLARTNAIPLTLASNATAQKLARSNTMSSVLASNTAGPKLLGPTPS